MTKNKKQSAKINSRAKTKKSKSVFTKLNSAKCLENCTKSKSASDCFKSSMNKDISKAVNYCLNSANCNISHSLDTSNILINTLNDLFVKASGMNSNAVQDNISLGKDFLKCRHINDFFNFQKKMFELHFSNLTHFYFDAVSTAQKTYSENVKYFFNNIDKKVCCFGIPK